MGLILMVVGFMWWWPLGLVVLAALIANGRIGYRRRLQFAGSGPMGDWDHVTTANTHKSAKAAPDLHLIAELKIGLTRILRRLPDRDRRKVRSPEAEAF